MRRAPALGPPILALAALLAGCSAPPPPPETPAAPAPALPAAAAPPAEPPPTGRLPADVRPLRYALELEIAPAKERFRGTVEIAVELDRRREVIWLHGAGMTSSAASVEPEGGAPVSARFEPITRGGLVALRPERPVGPGRATLRVAFDAPFGKHLHGLFKVVSAGHAYAFTQMEPTSARHAFPCFDEPSHKTPFDVTLLVPRGERAIANARETGRVAAAGDLDRVTFATTERLPTYLVAFAVGPLDVVAAPDVAPGTVRARPLPLRGVAARGHGPELAYALERTGPILSVLEDYFGVEYPYDKLDVLAVPDMGGAMENAGAVTFREWLLLVDPERSPIDQRRAFASVMAHELAHQWFGNLVTMPWWDDLWLNEAFATWMAARAVDAWRPEDQASTTALSRVHETMGHDSLLSARQIRQPVLDQNDIDNAFDGITYTKGGAVIAMFERWLGPEVFRAGIRAYMQGHRHGSATSTDFLAAISKAAGKDVAAPFETFLLQPGVPHVEASLSCGEGAPALLVEQSRFLPLGSGGDPARTWQIPVCVRHAAGKAVKETCSLLTEKKGRILLGDEKAPCPSWVMPNADAAGYYRWSLPRADLRRIEAAGHAALTVRERMSVAASLKAAFARGSMPAAEVMASLEPLAKDAHPEVATAPMGLLSLAREWLGPESVPAIEAYARRLYEGAYAGLGWAPKKGARETPEQEILRQRVISFLASTARHPKVRADAAARGRAYVGFGGDGALHPEAVDPNLAGLALAIAVEDGDATLFDALLARLAKTEDALVRARLIGALGAARRPELSTRALALTLDDRLRVSEMFSPLFAQLDQLETREAAWQWLGAHLDAIIARASRRRAGSLPWAAARFCDQAHADAAERLFGPRLKDLEGAPRNLAGAKEQIGLCVARKAAQIESMRAFFTPPRKPPAARAP